MSIDKKEIRLPKRAIEKVHLGQSFAEYDTALSNASIFVHTPALNAAANFDNPHCFFVGRRGTGKTTITRYLDSTFDNVLVIRPELFSPSGSPLSLDQFRDAKQRPFRSLTAAFRRSLQDEVIAHWHASSSAQVRGVEFEIIQELEAISDLDFDLRALFFIEELIKPLAGGDDQDWLKAIKKPKLIAKSMAAQGIGRDLRYSVLIDAIDDSWDGSELAVIYLTALMHACLEINSHGSEMRALVFLRENIFERVRVVDPEFSRLETCVVGLDWTEEQLLEMVERRLNAPLTAKLPLNSVTWDLFFERGEEAQRLVFDFCQRRPRDVLTYTALALDNAQSHKHEQILIEDLQGARRRFSDSRLSDLGDEYQENYPQIALVLSRFYGLGQRWTLAGIESLLNRIILDEQVSSACSEWIYEYSTPELFVRLLYNIGFIGLSVPRRGRSREGSTRRITFRSLGPKDTTPPAITSSVDIIVHQSYWDSLDLQDVLVTDFSDTEPFRKFGLVSDLPGSLELEEYQDRLRELITQVKQLPNGRDGASQFEILVGEVLKLCFFRVLFNVEPQVRDADGVVRRDWIASNRAQAGFWETVRQRFQATQVVFECKNYEELEASDFQQAAYYMTSHAGKLVFIVFRGETKNHYYQHIKRIHSSNDGIIILLNDRDLLVFLRQALNGKTKDDHLLDRYDRTVRSIG
jgi:hypothetical protein